MIESDAPALTPNPLEQRIRALEEALEFIRDNAKSYGASFSIIKEVANVALDASGLEPSARIEDGGNALIPKSGGRARE